MRPLPTLIVAVTIVTLAACGDSSGGPALDVGLDAEPGDATAADVVDDMADGITAVGTPDATGQASETEDAGETADSHGTAPHHDTAVEVDSTDTSDAVPEEPPCSGYGEPQPAGTLASGITEASGLVLSAVDPGLLWTHNDSGGAAHLYALSTDDGSLVADLALPTITPYDWEDLSNGPCAPGDGTRGCLYVGDFGDNQSIRSSVVVHRLAEPVAPSGEVSAEAVESMVLQYPDGARDCESMIVDDQANIWLLSKEWGIGTFRVYTAPFAASETPITLTFVSEHDLIGIPGELLSILTAADYRPDLRPDRLIVRLYQVALEYRLGPDGLHDIASAERVVVPDGEDVQGESIAYGDHGYWHTSEGSGAPIWFVPCAD